MFKIKKRGLPKFVYTNGAYDVLGYVFKKRVVGTIIKSKYPLVYDVGDNVEFPLYHIDSDTEPQFISTQELRMKKIMKLNDISRRSSELYS